MAKYVEATREDLGLNNYVMRAKLLVFACIQLH